MNLVCKKELRTYHSDGTHIDNRYLYAKDSLFLPLCAPICAIVQQ